MTILGIAVALFFAIILTAGSLLLWCAWPWIEIDVSLGGIMEKLKEKGWMPLILAVWVLVVLFLVMK